MFTKNSFYVGFFWNSQGINRRYQLNPVQHLCHLSYTLSSILSSNPVNFWTLLRSMPCIIAQNFSIGRNSCKSQIACHTKSLWTNLSTFFFQNFFGTFNWDFRLEICLVPALMYVSSSITMHFGCINHSRYGFLARDLAAVVCLSVQLDTFLTLKAWRIDPSPKSKGSDCVWSNLSRYLPSRGPSSLLVFHCQLAVESSGSLEQFYHTVEPNCFIIHQWNWPGFSTITTIFFLSKYFLLGSHLDNHLIDCDEILHTLNPDWTGTYFDQSQTVDSSLDFEHRVIS